MNKPYTQQECFDIIWERAKNPVKAKDGQFCKYRTPDGNRCFIGALIPDEEYSRDFELLAGIMDVYKRVSTLDGSLFDFYKDLQFIHDYNSPEIWNSQLQELARKNNLTVPND